MGSLHHCMQNSWNSDGSSVKPLLKLSNSILQKTLDVITYPFPKLSWTMLKKRAPVILNMIQRRDLQHDFVYAQKHVSQMEKLRNRMHVSSVGSKSAWPVVSVWWCHLQLWICVKYHALSDREVTSFWFWLQMAGQNPVSSVQRRQFLYAYSWMAFNKRRSFVINFRMRWGMLSRK